MHWYGLSKRGGTLYLNPYVRTPSPTTLLRPGRQAAGILVLCCCIHFPTAWTFRLCWRLCSRNLPSVQRCRGYGIKFVCYCIVHIAYKLPDRETASDSRHTKPGAEGECLFFGVKSAFPTCELREAVGEAHAKDAHVTHGRHVALCIHSL